LAASLGAVSLGAVPPTAPPATAAANWWHPGPLTSWQYAIGEPLPIEVPTNIGNVEVYDIDEGNQSGVSAGEVAASVAAMHARGARAICYVDSGGWENYRSDASEYSAAILGGDVSGYPDERYVDIRQWSDDPGPTGLTLGQILTARFQLCKDEGFDGVETDLDDTYADSTGLPLTMADEVAFMTEMADVIHGLGMAWFLKNGINGDSLISDMAALADGTVNEQCWQYDECSALEPFAQAGKPVLDVEYADEAEATTCPAALAFPMATMHTDVDLDGTIAWACWQYRAGTTAQTTTSMTDATTTTARTGSTSPTTVSRGSAKTTPAVGLRPHAPEFLSPPRATATVGHRFSFQVAASGNPLPVLAHSRLPSGLLWTSHGPGRATITGAPVAPAAGLTKVSLSAVNSSGRAHQVLTILVRRRPGLANGAPPVATVGRPYRFVFSAYGFPVPSLKESGTLPPGLVFRPKGDGQATLSGLPERGSQGAHPITIRVSNSLGALTVHYKLLVTGRTFPRP
jgi:endo-alpha-1,4-polygalactosaminidase (GH114 family)